jgi:alpha-L-fucosidase
MMIMDFANDDNFKTSWNSNPSVKEPWWEVDLLKETGFNTVVMTAVKANPLHYKLEYFANNKWHALGEGQQDTRIKVLHFDQVIGQKIRVKFSNFKEAPSIAEFGVYNRRM